MSSPPRTGPPLLDAEQEGVLATQAETELARRSIASSIVYVLAFSAVLLATPYATDPTKLSTAMAVLFLFLGLARLYLALGRHQDWRPGLWVGAFFVTTIANASVWSFLSCYSLFQHGFDTTSFRILLCTAGICAGGTTSLSPRPLIHITFLLVLLVPPALSALRIGGREAPEPRRSSGCSWGSSSFMVGSTAASIDRSGEAKPGFARSSSTRPCAFTRSTSRGS